ncbi:unnamed protein product [Hydatigera taeniaeformis]|uniref:Uncharacterized protein n=1 Tax=Hydatigena taeniaeformis TaxID=6205 RepID=A0A0R3WSP8_HYDTA|nr:unnamed protein product [Hydatigera taeniaeformis]
MVCTGDCDGTFYHPDGIEWLIRLYSQMHEIEAEAAPSPSPSAENNRGNLEASLSDALSKLLLQRRQYLSEDEGDDSDSF